MNFESELKNGKFVIGECIKCKKIGWPPSDFCRFCFGDVSWREPRQPGTLVEYSSKDGRVFAIVEFESVVRIIGTIADHVKVQIGQKTYIKSCEYDNGPKFTFGI